jgi:CRISPR-associated protein Cas6
MSAVATPDASHTVADLVFAVRGEQLPLDYRQALWTALCGAAPWLKTEPQAAVHGIRTVPTERAVVLLSRRARLTLRLPTQRLGDAAAALEGLRLDIGGHPLELGPSHVRALPLANTLYADFVTTGSADEMVFRDQVTVALSRLGTPGRMICGRARSLHVGDQEVTGYALALHDLSPESALRLLHQGLGDRRELGCGVFVQYKAISAPG